MPVSMRRSWTWTSSKPSKRLSLRTKQARSYARANTGSLLTGRIFDGRGNRMTPSTANARGVRYRYAPARVRGFAVPRHAEWLVRAVAQVVGRAPTLKKANLGLTVGRWHG